MLCNEKQRRKRKKSENKKYKKKLEKFKNSVKTEAKM